MARRHCSEPILPFPPHTDRNHFAAWLSGFADGEGSFQLRIQGTKNLIFSAAFGIKLRADELPILRQIRSFFGCGTFIFQRSGVNPTFTYMARKTMDLHCTIVPHFTAFPLLAKKAGDFTIWREGVALLATVWHRPSSIAGRCRDGTVGGTAPRWSPAERELFRQLHDTLRRQRAYSPAHEPKPVPPPRSLFDTPGS